MIDLGELTGDRETAANNGYAKIQTLVGEILALDTQYHGEERAAIREEHDRVMGYNIRQFLFQCLKKGFKQWLADYVYRKGDLLRMIDDREAQQDMESTSGVIEGEQGDVDGIVGGMD